MSQWMIFERQDQPSDQRRWIQHWGGGMGNWEADEATTARLTDQNFTWPLTPTGPRMGPPRTEGELFLAALGLIPDPIHDGATPQLPAIPQLQEGTVG